MTLADTPMTWLEGPSLSTLHALAIFMGIPLLVIVAISLLVYAPSWVHGPRYRPGQPWDSKSEWFGVSAAAEPATGLLESRGRSAAGETADREELSDQAARDESGGASAGW